MSLNNTNKQTNKLNSSENCAYSLLDEFGDEINHKFKPGNLCSVLIHSNSPSLSVFREKEEKEKR